MQGALDLATEFTAPLQDLVTSHAWGNTWQREGNDLRTRSIDTVSMLVALGRREWCLLMLGLIPLAHAGAISIVLLDAIDRYQAPLYPLMSVVACYGFAAVAGSIRGAREASSRTPLDQ